jgi:hypothetical protein
MVFPLVMKHDAALAAEFEKDHEVDHKLTEELRDSISTFEQAASSEDKIRLGQKIFYAFNEFIAFNLYHMNKEENVLLYALWSNYSDAELMDMSHRIVASIAPDVMKIEAEWMLRSMSNDEIVVWMKGVQMGATEEMYLQLVGAAQHILPQERWLAVHAALEPKMALV